MRIGIAGRIAGLGVLALGFSLSVAGQAGKQARPVDGKPVKDEVKGSILHGGGKHTWERITGRARVVDARTLEFDDGTRVPLHLAAPDLDQQGLIDGKLYPCGKEAAEFLRKLIGDRPAACYYVAGQEKWLAYVGDTNVTHEMIVNGWALAHHSSLHAAEIIARENKRGLWRGEFVSPDDWRAGKRLPAEK
jgi:endonuclease YncB( thermonuclease family)